MRVTLDNEDWKRLDLLKMSLSESRCTANKATYLSRVKFFEEGKRRSNKYYVEALLAYWLSYFVFPCSPDGLHNYIFPLAILLAEGERMALAFTWALYTPGLMNVCAISSTRLVDKVLSSMSMRPFSRVPMGEVQGFIAKPLGFKAVKLEKVIIMWKRGRRHSITSLEGWGGPTWRPQKKDYK